MNKNLSLLMLVFLLLSSNYIHGDEKIIKEKSNPNLEEKEYIIFDLRTYDKFKEDKDKKIYSPEDIKNSFFEHNKDMSLQELDAKMKEYQAKSSSEKREDLRNNIWDLRGNQEDLYEKAENIEDMIALNASLPDTDPNKLPPQKIAELDAQQSSLEESADDMNENIKKMETNYVMLDFKQITDELNAEYNEDSIESFKKTQGLNIDTKVLDIVETEISIRMKENELKFLRCMLQMQKRSFELGYMDESSIKEAEERVDLSKKDLEGIKTSLNTKLDELELLSGIKKIDGLKIDKAFFDINILSKKPRYYRDKYEKNSYQIKLLEDQVKEMEKATKKLKTSYDAGTDTKIMDTNKQKTEVQKEIILDGVEMGALSLTAGFDNLFDEKEKLALKIEAANRKTENNKIRFSLGYISKLDLIKSNFESSQLTYAGEVLDMKIIRLKLLLNAMANGIVQK